MTEILTQTFTDSVTCTFSNRRGRSCIISHVDSGRLSTLSYNSFMWRVSPLFNDLPRDICNITQCSICSFTSELDGYLSTNWTATLV